MKQSENLMKLFIIALLLILLSCNNLNRNFKGIYIINDITKGANIKSDTLIINSDSTYIHILYSPIDECLIYKNRGNWFLTDKYIVLQDFKNDYFNINCKCKQKKYCYVPFNILLKPNFGKKVKVLNQDTYILEGITYVKISQ